MFTVCVGPVFRRIYLQFPIICSLQYSININTVEVDPHSDFLHICIVKPKNIINSDYMCLAKRKNENNHVTSNKILKVTL